MARGPTWAPPSVAVPRLPDSVGYEMVSFANPELDLSEVLETLADAQQQKQPKQLPRRSVNGPFPAASYKEKPIAAAGSMRDFYEISPLDNSLLILGTEATSRCRSKQRRRSTKPLLMTDSRGSVGNTTAKGGDEEASDDFSIEVILVENPRHHALNGKEEDETHEETDKLVCANDFTDLSMECYYVVHR